MHGSMERSPSASRMGPWVFLSRSSVPLDSRHDWRPLFASAATPGQGQLIPVGALLRLSLSPLPPLRQVTNVRARLRGKKV